MTATDRILQILAADRRHNPAWCPICNADRLRIQRGCVPTPSAAPSGRAGFVGRRTRGRFDGPPRT